MDVLAGVAVFKAVDHGVKALVVAADGIKHLPDGFPAIVVVEVVLGRGSGRNDDGKNDIAELLGAFGRLAHDAADGLDNLDLGFAGVHEKDCVKCGDVDAFGEAAGVGEDVAMAIGDGGEEVECLCAARGVERTVDVLGLNGLGSEGGNDVSELLCYLGNGGSDVPGGFDEVAEGDGAAHGDVGVARELVLVGLGEGAEAADDLALFVEGEGLAFLEGVEGYPGGKGLRNCENDDAVVREDAVVDGFSEAELVDGWAVAVLVVHGAERCGELAGAGAGTFSVDLGGRGHVEAPVAANAGVVVDAYEGGWVLSGNERAGGAMGFIRDGEVEGWQAVFGLGFLEYFGRVIGGENDSQGAVRSWNGMLGKSGGIGGRGIGEVEDVDIGCIGLGTAGPAGLGVGADSEGAERKSGVERPGAEGLGQERQAGNENQYATAGAGELFGNAEANERLAGAAGHENLAAGIGAL